MEFASYRKYKLFEKYQVPKKNLQKSKFWSLFLYFFTPRQKPFKNRFLTNWRRKTLQMRTKSCIAQNEALVSIKMYISCLLS